MLQPLSRASSVLFGCFLLLLAPPAHGQSAKGAKGPPPKAVPKEQPKAVPLIDRLCSPYQADRPLKDKPNPARPTRAH